jgi:hypothetical protein
MCVMMVFHCAEVNSVGYRSWWQRLQLIAYSSAPESVFFSAGFSGAVGGPASASGILTEQIAAAITAILMPASNLGLVALKSFMAFIENFGAVLNSSIADRLRRRRASCWRFSPPCAPQVLTCLLLILLYRSPDRSDPTIFALSKRFAHQIATRTSQVQAWQAMQGRISSPRVLRTGPIICRRTTSKFTKDTVKVRQRLETYLVGYLANTQIIVDQ